MCGVLFFFFFSSAGFCHSLEGHYMRLESQKCNKINSFLEKEGMEKTAERLQTTVHTLQVIIDGLSQPKSFDFSNR